MKQGTLPREGVRKRLRFRQVLIFLSMLVLAISASSSARAQEAEDSTPPVAPDNAGNVRVARLGFFYGSAQVELRGADWQDAQINLPLEEGAKIRTEDGRAEIQFDDGSILRLAQSTTVELTELSLATGRPATKVDLLSGTAILIGKIIGGETFRVVAPSIELDVPNGASFRVDVAGGNSWVTALNGVLQIAAAGAANPLSAGNMLHLGADGQTDVEASPAADDFDTWSADRDRMLANGSASAEQYVAPYQPQFDEAAADLSAYGYWGNISGCGACWIPYGVSARWMPFGLGSWCYYGNLGWTWISAEPWGWLPYHFGRWFYTTHGWAWSPNPVRRFHPGAVDWIKVDGKTAWVPRGSFANARRPDGTAGYVTGTAASDGVIRSERGTGSATSTGAGSSPIIISARPPAPSSPKSVSNKSKTITYDPGSRTYVNGEPTNSATRENTLRRATPVSPRNEGEPKEDEPKPDRPIAVRPQFGPPSTYSPAATRPTMSAPSESNAENSRPTRGATETPASNPHGERESTGNSAPPPRHSESPSRPATPPVTQHASPPAPAPHASAPALTPHSSSGTPHR
jgi:ferric-dicitrate binding protein FerR (iron transport regulator)